MTDANRAIELIEALDGSTSLQVGAILGIITEKNVGKIVDAMPDDFRDDFLEWCAVLRRGGAPSGDWSPNVMAGFVALNDWLDDRIECEFDLLDIHINNAQKYASHHGDDACASALRSIAKVLRELDRRTRT